MGGWVLYSLMGVVLSVLAGAGCARRAVPLTPPGYWDRLEVKQQAEEATRSMVPPPEPGGPK